MNATAPWLSADWGTTSFRLRCVAGASLTVRAERRSDQGIAATWDLWKKSGKPETERLDFYRNFLLSEIRALETAAGSSLAGLPLVLSGMAGATIGMLNTDYQPMPFRIDGSGLKVQEVAASERFPFAVRLISGVRSENDVMRGEETMLVGAAAAAADFPVQWFLFPGTHSKHIRVEKGLAMELHTFMTGELFALLSGASVLSASVEKTDIEKHLPAFTDGVRAARQGLLSQQLFSVRVNGLFGKLSAPAGYAYLSGLLIGHELLSLVGKPVPVLVAAGPLTALYAAALETAGHGTGLQTVDADEALVRGQWQIALR